MSENLFDLDLVNAAAARYKARTPERKEALKRVKAEGALAADSPARAAARREELNPLDDRALERVVGADDLVPLRYLEGGLQAARSVCKVQLVSENGFPAGSGTGFLVSPNLLITNNHVLKSRSIAARGLAEFNFDQNLDLSMKPVKTFRLQPDRFFYTNKSLDFSLAAVHPTATDNSPLADFGHLKLIAESGKALLGEFVTIIQHPQGWHKFIALRNNRVLDVFDDFAHYETDTLQGSSGAAVFNDQWWVAFLHHSGVPKRDAQGRILDKDGRLWKEEEGDDKKIDWIANEGVRISSIVRHLQEKQDWTPAEKALIDELVPDSTGD